MPHRRSMLSLCERFHRTRRRACSSVITIVPPSAVSDCADRLLARPLPPPNRRGSVPGVPVGPGEHRIVFRASAVHPGTSTDASLVRLVADSSDCGLNVSCRSDLASRRPPAPAPSPSQPNRPLTRRTRFGFLDREGSPCLNHFHPRQSRRRESEWIGRVGPSS